MDQVASQRLVGAYTKGTTIATMVRSWIFPTSFEEGVNRRALLLNTMALLAMAASAVINGALFIVTLRDHESKSFLLALVTLVVSELLFGTVLFLSRTDRVAAGSHLLLWSGVVVATASNLLDPNSSMRDPSWYLFAIFVIAAALLLGMRWAMAFAAIEVLLYLAGYLAERAGYIPRAPSLPDIIYDVAMFGGSLLVLAALGWLFNHGLEEALRKARLHAAESEEARQRLESAQLYLERTVADYTAFAQRVAAGDLTSSLVLPQEDNSPLVQLGRNLNTMVQGLTRISAEVRGAADNISGLSSRILETTSQQAAATTEQSAALTQATATIMQVRAIAEQTADRAQGVAALAQQTAEVSLTGKQAVAATVTGMAQVKDRVESIATDVLALLEQTRTIGTVIAMVNEIAAQSNILALNAAVEAARAGEAGRGFAVVAAEVRNLAGQSRTATQQVRDILIEIQRGVTTTVAAMEEGVQGTESGVRLAGSAGDALIRLTESVSTSTQSAQQIAVAAQQQLLGMEQITAAMENIRQATGQTTVGARQMQEAAAEMNLMAGGLREAVGQYRF